MDTILGMELPLLVKFVLSFAIVLLLIGAAAMAVRKFGGKTLIPGAAMRGRQPRLAIIDRAPVDSRRSLVIVRRDNVEHLLLIGGPTDVLVEANIPAAAVQPVREPEPEVRAPAIEPAATRPSAVAPVAVPPVVEAPAESEPAIKPEPRLDVRTEPDLLPEPRPETEVQVPHVPAFAPAPPAVAARKEVAATDVVVEPRQPNLPPPVAVPPLPAAAPMAQAPDDALARFAQDLDAHRDHINGEALAQKLAAQAPPAPPSAQAAPSRPIEPTFSEDQNLADMALRLEAALRRPLGANGVRPVPQQPRSRKQCRA